MNVIAALGKIVKANQDSYHHLLRDAYLQIPPMVLGNDWPDTQKLLHTQGLSTLQLGDENVLRSRCIVHNRAVHFPSGHCLNLFIEMEAPRGERDQFGFPAPGKVTQVSVGLEGAVDEPFEDVLEDRLFLEGTVLDTILQSKDARLLEAVSEYANLDFVEVSYGYTGDKRLAVPSWGFNVIFTLSSAKTPSRKTKLLFNVESGLDLGLREAVQIAKRDNLGRVREGKAYVEAGDKLLPIEGWRREFGDNFPGFKREDKLIEISCSGIN